MPLKLTLKLSGHDVVLEGDAADVVTAFKAITPEAPLPPQRSQMRRTGAVDVPSTDGVDTIESPIPGRAPRGENKKLALQVLAAEAPKGLRQAHVGQAIAAKMGGERISVSSVRHALHQLREEGWARCNDDIWSITSAGFQALAKFEVTK